MTNFKIDVDYDVRLLPFSPVSQQDTVEIRVKGYNDGESGNATVVFKLDGETVGTETVFVESGNYGSAICKVSMAGKVGTHTVFVNDVSVPLEVMEKPVAKLDGGFLLIGPPNDRTSTDSFRADLKSFTDENWDAYMDALVTIGCQCVVIQNCQEFCMYRGYKPNPEDLTAHYVSKLHPKSDTVAEAPLERILKKAEEHDIKVFLSVGNCYAPTQCDMDCYEMYELFGKYKAFYGWYLSFEADLATYYAHHWEFLQRQVNILRQISPEKPLLVSPHGFPCPDVVEYIRNHDVFDIMMPQDCVGQTTLTIAQSGEMHRRLKEVCDHTGKHFWANCESFNVLNGVLVPRYEGGGMDGEAGFVQQIEIVRPFVEKIMTFAYTGFFTPPDFTPVPGGEKTIQQFEDYKRYYERINNGN